MQADPVTIIGAWSIILAIASKSPVRGCLYLAKDEPYTSDDIADMLEWKEQDTDILLDNLIAMGMMDYDDGVFVVSNWGKRQYESDNSTKRVRKHRNNETLQKRYCNVSVTPPDTDTESESESEINDDDEGDKNEKTSNLQPQSNIFSLYEQNIGILTPIIAEKLKSAEQDYPQDWFPWAFGQAVTNNARSWAYIDACLKNRRDGKDHVPRARSPSRNNKDPGKTNEQIVAEVARDLAKGLATNARK